MLRFVVAVVLGCWVLAARQATLLPIDEDSTWPPPATTPAHDASQPILPLTDALHRDAEGSLHEPTLSYTLVRYRIMRRIQVTGLVRAQQGTLVPFALQDTVNLFPDLQSHTGIPASNMDIHRLLGSIPDITSTYDAREEPRVSQLGQTYYAVELRGRGLDRQVVETLLRWKKPFFLRGAGDKLWYVHTNDGNWYTFTDRVRGEDRRFLTAHFGGASSLSGARRDLIRGGTLAEGRAAHRVRLSTASRAWMLRKIYEGARTALGRVIRST